MLGHSLTFHQFIYILVLIIKTIKVNVLIVRFDFKAHASFVSAVNINAIIELLLSKNVLI